jgi:hypothetical protein
MGAFILTAISAADEVSAATFSANAASNVTVPADAVVGYGFGWD